MRHYKTLGDAIIKSIKSLDPNPWIAKGIRLGHLKRKLEKYQEKGNFIWTQTVLPQFNISMAQIVQN